MRLHLRACRFLLFLVVSSVLLSGTSSTAQALFRYHLKDASYPENPKMKHRGRPQALPNTKKLLSKRKLSWILAVGSGRNGYESVRFSSTGNGVFVFQSWRNDPRGRKIQIWRYVRFSVNKREMAQMRMLLAKCRHAFSRTAVYADVSDGTQAFLKLSLDAKNFNSFFDNHFPKPLLRLVQKTEAVWGARLRKLKKGAKTLTRSMWKLKWVRALTQEPVQKRSSP